MARLGFGLLALYFLAVILFVAGFVVVLVATAPWVIAIVAAVVGLAWLIGGAVKRWVES
jgi:hypothetical protein